MGDYSQIQLVKDQAEEKQRQLSDRYQQALEFVQNERQQLVQLQDYEADYMQRIKQTETQWSIQTTSPYRHFSYQLSQTIQEQSAKIDDAEQHLDKMRNELQQQQHRIQILDDIIRREEVANAHLQNQLIQKEMDEYSTRLYSN